MVNSKKIFVGGIDNDNDPRLVAATDVLNMENCRIGTSEDGKNGRIENMYGTTLVALSDVVAGDNLTIGSAVDARRNRVFYFNQNSLGFHHIYCYDKKNNTTLVTLLDSQVTGGLNFDKLTRIDRNAKVVGDLLYWTDYNNEPKCINIESALVTNNAGYVTTAIPYVFPLAATSITIIKRPPAYQLGATKIYDTSYLNNNTAYNSFQFYYRYRFYDFQESANSAMSALMPYNFADEKFNSIDLVVPLAETIMPDVKEVQLIAQFGNIGKAFIIKIYDKANADDAILIAAHNSGTALTYRFYNDFSGIALDSIAQTNSQDLIALKVKTLEVTKDRLFFGGLLKGYNSPTQTSLSVSLTNTVAPSISPIAKGITGDVGFNTPTTIPLALTAIPPASLDTANYKLQTQPYSGAGQGGGSYPTFNDHQGIYRDKSNVITTFVITGKASLYNGIRDIDMSLYYYIVQSPNLKSVRKIATYIVKKEVELFINFNVSIKVPGNAEVYFVIEPSLPPDSGHLNDSTLKITSSLVYIVPNNSIPALPPHFKTNGSYKFATAFYDRYRRKCGIVTNDSSKLSIPKRGYNPASSNYATWLLSNTNALTEIPNWAYTYQILVTKNTKQASFIQGVAQSVYYAVKDLTTNEITYTENTYSPNSFAIAVNLGGITDLGVGYTFSEGDLINLANDNGDTYTLRVTGQNGNWVHCEKQNLGLLGGTFLWLFEIYTENKESLNDNYYEVSPVYDIFNPTTNTRAYTTLVGDLQGDTYFLIRSDSVNAYYQCETMNPNDKFWSIWDRSLGWINLKDNIGQRNLTNQFEFTDTFIPGTQTNGLNRVQPLNYKTIGSEAGSIQKLQLASKQQEDGQVMLCVCENDTLSIYLGETQLVSNKGNAYLASSDGIVGTINSLKAGYGTQNPESIFGYLGDIFGVDVSNGVVWQYATNGQFPVSSYKMSRFFYKYCKEYSKMPTDTTGLLHITTCIDVVSREIMFVLPAVGSQTDINFPSYTTIPPYTNSIRNRMDAYDGKAKAISFKPDLNIWRPFYEIQPEWMDYIDTQLIGFKGGRVYLHNDDKVHFNRMYGVDLPVRIMLAANESPSQIKTVKTIALEANAAPNYTVVYADYPNVQITDLVKADYINKEGIFYADTYKDRLSPNITGTPEDKMYKGDEITDAAPKIMVEYQVYDRPLQINFVDIGLNESSGHEQIKSKG